MDQAREVAEPADAAGGQPPGDRPVRSLDIGGAHNAREKQLLDWVAAGRTNAQIGQCTGRSEKTIRNQLTGVYVKLGVVNRSEAVAVYLRMQFRAGQQLDPVAS